MNKPAQTPSLNLELFKLQLMAKAAASKGMPALASKLTEKAASMHSGEAAKCLNERATHYQEQA